MPAALPYSLPYSPVCDCCLQAQAVAEAVVKAAADLERERSDIEKKRMGAIQAAIHNR